MVIKDRFVRGFVSGAIAAVPASILDYLASLLHVERVFFRHFLSVMIYGRYARNPAERVFSQVSQLLFMGLLGIVFAYLIKRTGDRLLYVKGFIYGAAAWFLLLASGTIIRLQPIWHVSLKTAAAHLVVSVVFGLILAWALRWLGEPHQHT